MSMLCWLVQKLFPSDSLKMNYSNWNFHPIEIWSVKIAREMAFECLNSRHAYVFIHTSLSLSELNYFPVTILIFSWHFQLIAFQVSNGLCVGCSIQMLVYGGLVIASCKNPGDEGRCVGDVIGIVASNGAAVAIGCVFVVIVFANYVMYGVLRSLKTCSSSCNDGGECGK